MTKYIIALCVADSSAPQGFTTVEEEVHTTPNSFALVAGWAVQRLYGNDDAVGVEAFVARAYGYEADSPFFAAQKY